MRDGDWRFPSMYLLSQTSSVICAAFRSVASRQGITASNVGSIDAKKFTSRELTSEVVCEDQRDHTLTDCKSYGCYNPSLGGNVADLSKAVRDLQAERKRLQGELNALGKAIAALSSLIGSDGRRPRHRMSAAARRRIAAAQ